MSDDGAAETGAKRERRGGRGGRSARAEATGTVQKPFRQPQRRFPPTEVVSADELEAIHNASLTVLEEIGMDFLEPQARALLQAAGADVRAGSERVRFDRHFILDKIKTAPAEFTLHARNPAHNLRFGGDNVIFAQVASTPNASDLDGGRRPGNRQDFQNFVRLGAELQHHPHDGRLSG